MDVDEKTLAKLAEDVRLIRLHMRELAILITIGFVGVILGVLFLVLRHSN